MPATVPAYVPKHGIVSLLDPANSRSVRRIWERLESDLGLRGVLVMPYPHFSYQIAGGYDRPAVEAALRTVAHDLPKFSVRTTGVGQFEGPWPVVFLHVERSASLQALHERIWNTCRPLATNPVEYYRPGAWVPHITLAHGEEHRGIPLPARIVPRIQGCLRAEELRWKVHLDNLTLVWDDGQLQKPLTSFGLQGT